MQIRCQDGDFFWYQWITVNLVSQKSGPCKVIRRRWPDWGYITTERFRRFIFQSSTMVWTFAAEYFRERNSSTIVGNRNSAIPCFLFPFLSGSVTCRTLNTRPYRVVCLLYVSIWHVQIQEILVNIESAGNLCSGRCRIFLQSAFWYFRKCMRSKSLYIEISSNNIWGNDSCKEIMEYWSICRCKLKTQYKCCHRGETFGCR